MNRRIFGLLIAVILIGCEREPECTDEIDPGVNHNSYGEPQQKCSSEESTVGDRHDHD